MLIRHLFKQTRKRSKSLQKSKSQRGGGAGYLLQVESPRIGGQTERLGYSQCCPPLYQGGKLAYTASGNRMCGGGSKSKKIRKIGKLRKLLISCDSWQISAHVLT